MKKHPRLSILILLLLLVICGFLIVLVTTKQQEIRSRAGVDMVDLTLSASPNPVAIGSDVTVTVLINTKTYTVSAVELFMTYDTVAFDPVSVTAGTFLPTVLTTGSIQSGSATITLGSGTTPKKGSGMLATLKLKRKNTSSGIVQVDAKTKIAGLDTSGSPIPTSILGTMGSVTITSLTNPTSMPTVQTTSTPIKTPTKVPSVIPTSPLIKSSPTPFSSPTPLPTGSGGFGGLLSHKPVDTQKNTPTPLSLANNTISTIIPEPEIPEEFPETTSPLEEITPETTFPENFEVSSSLPPKQKSNIFLVFFGIISFIGVFGGIIAFILHRKFGYTLPFFKKRPDRTTPSPTPSDQTQEANPPTTDQTLTPPSS